MRITRDKYIMHIDNLVALRCLLCVDCRDRGRKTGVPGKNPGSTGEINRRNYLTWIATLTACVTVVRKNATIGIEPTASLGSGVKPGFRLVAALVTIS